jgi:hypothetical protein
VCETSTFVQATTLLASLHQISCRPTLVTEDGKLIPFVTLEDRTGERISIRIRAAIANNPVAWGGPVWTWQGEPLSIKLQTTLLLAARCTQGMLKHYRFCVTAYKSSWHCNSLCMLLGCSYSSSCAKPSTMWFELNICAACMHVNQCLNCKPKWARLKESPALKAGLHWLRRYSEKDGIDRQ